MDWAILAAMIWLVLDRLLWFAAGVALGLALEWRLGIVDRLLGRLCRWTSCERK